MAVRFLQDRWVYILDRCYKNATPSASRVNKWSYEILIGNAIRRYRYISDPEGNIFFRK